MAFFSQFDVKKRSTSSNILFSLLLANLWLGFCHRLFCFMLWGALCAISLTSEMLLV